MPGSVYPASLLRRVAPRNEGSAALFLAEGVEGDDLARLLRAGLSVARLGLVCPVGGRLFLDQLGRRSLLAGAGCFRRSRRLGEPEKLLAAGWRAGSGAGLRRALARLRFLELETEFDR